MGSARSPIGRSIRILVFQLAERWRKWKANKQNASFSASTSFRCHEDPCERKAACPINGNAMVLRLLASPAEEISQPHGLTDRRVVWTVAPRVSNVNSTSSGGEPRAICVLSQRANRATPGAGGTQRGKVQLAYAGELESQFPVDNSTGRGRECAQY
jgi:hypothetical protein